MKLEVKRRSRRGIVLLSLLGLGGAAAVPMAVGRADPSGAVAVTGGDQAGVRVRYQTVNVRGVDVFYREAGPRDAPAILLLHGFPTSSHMFRNLILQLAMKYRVIAPDYPGYGQSATPDRSEFEYSFDNLASLVDEFTQRVGLSKFVMYVQDYGAPIGYRIASAHPERISGLVVQNGNAYIEGLPDSFWGPIKKYWAEPNDTNRDALRSLLTRDATKWQYTTGVRDAGAISPDTWTIDQAGLDRPGNAEIQLDLFLSYGSNPPLYPKWQAYFREHQPPTLVVWGKNDPIFPASGAEPYKRDLKNIDFNLLDTGHFALEEDGGVIGAKILRFMEGLKP